MCIYRYSTVQCIYPALSFTREKYRYLSLADLPTWLTSWQADRQTDDNSHFSCPCGWDKCARVAILSQHGRDSVICSCIKKITDNNETESRRKPEIPEKTCEREYGLGNHLHIQPVARIEPLTHWCKGVQGEWISTTPPPALVKLEIYVRVLRLFRECYWQLEIDIDTTNNHTLWHFNHESISEIDIDNHKVRHIGPLPIK